MKNTIVSLIIRKRIKKIKLSINKPLEYQASVLKYLIKKAAQTQCGKTQSFNTIENYTDFTNQIPIRTYEQLEYYIKKIRNFEKNIYLSMSLSFRYMIKNK